MIYGHLQYYHEELHAWDKVVGFNKIVLLDLERQMNIVLNFPLVSVPVSRTGNYLIERLVILNNQLDEMHHHLEHQVQRVKLAILSDHVDTDTIDRQRSLRINTGSLEVAMIKVKNSCLIFLSEFFESNVSASVLDSAPYSQSS